MKSYPLEIIIPVYNEAENIRGVLDALSTHVKTSFRLLICFDNDNDTTLPVVKQYSAHFPIIYVKNKRKGAHGAIMTGFEVSSSEAVIVYPADDFINVNILDRMFTEFNNGHDIVCASRFMKGGSMKGCPWVKYFFTRLGSLSMHYIARIPVHDGSNGFRLFSSKVIKSVSIESTMGFTYSIELLVKCHRLGWKITEVPSQWIERTAGKSRFQVGKWLPQYFRWLMYGIATTYLRKSALTVQLKEHKYK